MPARGQRKPWPFLAPEDPLGMPALRLSWIEALKTRGCYGKDDPVYRFWKA